MTEFAAYFWAAARGDRRAPAQHVGLVAVSTVLAVAVGLPLGILLTRRPRLARPVLGVAYVVQTIPSLALFGFLIPLPLIGGIGARTAIVALVVYALLPILRNTYVGITSVDPATVEAAIGLGMTPGERLRGVELPLAFPVVARGRADRGGRLDRPRDDRRRRRRGRPRRPHLPGHRDGGHAADPRGCDAGGAARPRRGRRARVARDGAGPRRGSDAASLGGGLAGLAAFASCRAGRDRPIRVGSKNFTEQVILGEIAAQALETRGRAGRPAPRSRRQLSSATGRCVAGELDLYPEYTGTAFTAILKEKPVSDPAAVRSRVADGIRAALGPRLVAAARIREHFRARDAPRRRRRLGIAKISDLARHPELTARVRLRVRRARRTASRVSPRRTGSRSPAARRDGSRSSLPGARQPQGGRDRRQLDRRTHRRDGPGRARRRSPLLSSVRGGLRRARRDLERPPRARRARARSRAHRTPRQCGR